MARCMNSVVSDKRYVPVLPYYGTVWPRALGRYMPRFPAAAVRHVATVDDRGGRDKLRGLRSTAGDGVLITPNHTPGRGPVRPEHCWGGEVGRPFFVVASAHLFMGSRVQAFLLRRAGAFSIYREGMDKQAVQSSIDILTTAEAAAGDLPRGAHLADERPADADAGGDGPDRPAGCQAAGARTASGKVVVHPVALKYAFGFDVERRRRRTVLDGIEARLTWRPSRGLAAARAAPQGGGGSAGAQGVAVPGPHAGRARFPIGSRQADRRPC